MVSEPVGVGPSISALIAGYAAVYVLWGSTYLAIRIAIETLPPLLLASTRYLVAHITGHSAGLCTSYPVR